jgi:hypothetical protein
MKIDYNNKLIPNVLSTKFFGLTVDSTLSCRMHIDHITTKLSTACYVIRSIKPLMSHITLLLFYHSLFLYSHELQNNILGKFLKQYTNFLMQKTVIRIIMGCGNRDSCRILFKELRSLPHMSQYILSLLIFLVINRGQFLINSEIRIINMTHSFNHLLPSEILSRNMTQRCNHLLPLENLDIYQ